MSQKHRLIIWQWKLRKAVMRIFHLPEVGISAVSRVIFSDLPKSEWMKLIAAPLVLSFAGVIITNQFQQDATQNERLSKYFDQMQELTFTHKLMDITPPKETLAVARAKTLTTIRLLDDKRNQDLTGFLQDSGLIKGKNSVVKGAYLKRANLEEAKLKEANLIEANLIEANLKRAILYRALLLKANLEGAKLQEAFLLEAKLNQVNLNGANLQGAFLLKAKLNQAKLKGVNLIGVQLTHTQIKSACFWEQAIYKADETDNKKFTDEVKRDTLSNPIVDCSMWK